MVHQSTRCKKLQRVFYCNLSKKVQSGAPSGDENSSGPPPVRRAKTPQWGVFRARESPRWCTKKSRNECCGFFVAPFPLGRTRTSRKRSCSSRGDWSLKMAAGLWAGAMIERERKRGANNVRRARRTTARAVLRSKMEALQARQANRTEFLTRPLMVHQKAPCCKAGHFSYVDLYWENRHLVSGPPFFSLYQRI